MKEGSRLDLDDLEYIAGGVCVTKSGVRYYKADSDYIYYQQGEIKGKIGITQLQCMAGKTCKQMQSFIDKINDDKEYGPSNQPEKPE